MPMVEGGSRYLHNYLTRLLFVCGATIMPAVASVYDVIIIIARVTRAPATAARRILCSRAINSQLVRRRVENWSLFRLAFSHCRKSALYFVLLVLPGGILFL